MTRTYYVGVHDFFDSKLMQLYHVYHFHNIYNDIFNLDYTDFGDCFGESTSMKDPEDDYESFRYDGRIEVIDTLDNVEIPINFTHPGKADREYFDTFINVLVG
jgi:hypothetical protein